MCRPPRPLFSVKLADNEVAFKLEQPLSERFFSITAYLVLGIATLLRLLDSGSWSLSNDELSSWRRVQFDDFASLIELGVRNDVHPALGQSFMYLWLKFVPDNPIMIRLPYIILSCIGLYFFYAFAKKIIGSKAALPFLITLSFSYLFVVYHQIARPYALGFFMMSAFAFSWISLIKTKKLKYALTYAIFGALSLYTHYVLALSSLCLCIAGFVLIFAKHKGVFKIYLIATLSIGILFLPHLKITLHQLSLGGLDWLPKPQNDFLLEFFDYALNGSLLLILLIFIAPFISFDLSSLKQKKLAVWLLPFLFFVPFLTVFIYSLQIKPIIQFSLFTFSFPFLLLFFFSFLKNVEKSRYLIYNSILLIVAISSLFFPTNSLANKPFANFEGISKHLVDWKAERDEDLTVIACSRYPEYINYFYHQMGVELIADFDDLYGVERIEAAAKLIRESETDHLAMAFANINIPPEIYEYAKIFYPQIVEQHRYFNSEAILLKKNPNRDARDRELSFSSRLSNRNHSERWEVSDHLYSDSLFLSAPGGFQISENDEYALTYRAKVKHVFRDGSRWLTLKARMKSAAKNGILLAVSTVRGEEHLKWRSIECDYYHQSGEWYWVVFVYEIPNEALPNDDLLVYFMNTESGSALVDDVELLNYKDSNFDYFQLP